ncbi:MAG: hypothetical protein KKE20_06120 [Nanoarchaeota archaeon]|nr:hypothetical protein [Nanoarchaeota archaeon]
MGIFNAIMEAVGFKSYLDRHRVIALDDHEEKFILEMERLSDEERKIIEKLIEAKRANKHYEMGKWLRKLTGFKELEMDLIADISHLEQQRELTETDYRKKIAAELIGISFALVPEEAEKISRWGEERSVPSKELKQRMLRIMQEYKSGDQIQIDRSGKIVMVYENGDLKITHGSGMLSGFNKTVQQAWDEIKPKYIRNLRFYFRKLSAGVQS